MVATADNNYPLVSIITVVLNAEKTLAQTIQSVLDQSYKPIEYIIIDGGSTDGTLDIIKSYQSFLNHWHSEPDKGLYDAMNKGIGLSKGSLVGMINSDDWYEPNAVELVVDAYRKNSCKRIFHADRYDVHESGVRTIRKYQSSTFKFLYYGMTYNHPSMFIHSKEYLLHTYNTQLVALSDYQFVLEARIRDKNMFCYIDTPIVNYRLGGCSAQLGFVSSIREGLTARKNAGLSMISMALFLLVRVCVTGLKKISSCIGKYKPQRDKIG